MLDYNTSKNSVNSLLSILRSEGLNLPKDVRTLMNTPRHHTIISMQPGNYIHFGLKKMLLVILNFHKHYLNAFDEIKLSFNIDGLPLSKSSKQVFWPILCCIINVPQLNQLVFAVGIYYDVGKKPNCIEDFLNLFINEAVDLVNCGIVIDSGYMFKVSFSQVICDSPARSFLLNVKNFNARVGCNTCTEEGEYKDRRMVFLGTNAEMRTDKIFRERNDDEYHKGNTPLERLPIDMIKSVPLDYMHTVYLGVMKRLLKFWVRGKQSVRMHTDKRISCDLQLNNLRSYFPSEFS